MEAFESLDMPFNMTIGQAQSEIKLQFHPEQWKAFTNIANLIEEVRRCWLPADYRTAQQHLSNYIEHVRCSCR
jgi:hypothetical protein